MEPSNITKLKSGFLTSEFWMALASGVTGVLVMLGYLNPEQADAFVEAIVAVVGGLITVAATVTYIIGRVQLKRQLEVSGSQPSLLLEGLPDQPQTGAVVTPIQQ